MLSKRRAAGDHASAKRNHGTDTFNETLFGKLLQSELLTTYQDAFRCATGLPLKLVKPDAMPREICTGFENVSPFCAKLNVCDLHRELPHELPPRELSKLAAG